MNFDITYQLILPALQKIAELTHSYGWAIILLTIAFRVLVSPLVAQTTISMRKMSKLQPQMKAIQEQYKGQPEQLQKKLMEFYSKNKVNPMGGCLPTLIQLPILFALYAAFAGPPFTDKAIDVKVNVLPAGSTQSLSKEEVTGANSIYVSRDGVPAKVIVFPGNSTIIANTELNFGVRAVEGKLPANFMPQWKIISPNHEAKEANKAASIDSNGHVVFPTAGEYHVQAIIPGIAKEEPFAFISGLGKVATGATLLKPANYDVVFLIIMFGLSMYLSQKLTVPTPKTTEGQELDEQQIIQQQTMKTMPIVTTAMFFFFPIPAGVYLYLVVSNVIQTFQTWLITKMPEPSFPDSEGSTNSVVSNPKPNGIMKPNKKATEKPRAISKNGTAGGTKHAQGKKRSKRNNNKK